MLIPNAMDRSQDKDTAILDISNLLIQLTDTQRLCFLRHISLAQCRLIRFLCLNILLNTSIVLDEVDKSYLKRHTSAIKKLASKRVCTSDKKVILVRKQKLIKRVAEIVVKYLS